MCTADEGAARADAREVVAHAAAAPHGLGGFGQRHVDAGVAVFRLGDRVAHRLHEAVDQRGRHLGAGRRLDAPCRHEALAQRLGKALFPQRALGGRLGLGQGARHALVHRLNRALAALGVLLQQHFFADDLAGQIGDGAGCGFMGVLHGRASLQAL